MQQNRWFAVIGVIAVMTAIYVWKERGSTLRTGIPEYIATSGVMANQQSSSDDDITDPSSLPSGASAANSSSNGKIDTHPLGTVGEIVERSGSLVSAIDAAIALYGINDPQVSSLIEESAAACSEEMDRTDATNLKHEVKDSMRAWTVERLLNLCNGFDRSRWPPSASRKNDLGRMLRVGGEDIAVPIAIEAIAAPTDVNSLISAGQVLMETGNLPLNQILAGQESQYGPADLVPAWMFAAQLSSCAHMGGCGPSSLVTTRFCASTGCPQGFSFDQALQRNLSSHQYRAVSAFYQWILTQRR